MMSMKSLNDELNWAALNAEIDEPIEYFSGFRYLALLIAALVVVSSIIFFVLNNIA